MRIVIIIFQIRTYLHNYTVDAERYYTVDNDLLVVFSETIFMIQLRMNPFHFILLSAARPFHGSTYTFNFTRIRIVHIYTKSVFRQSHIRTTTIETGIESARAKKKTANTCKTTVFIELISVHTQWNATQFLFHRFFFARMESGKWSMARMWVSQCRWRRTMMVRFHTHRATINHLLPNQNRTLYVCINVYAVYADFFFFFRSVCVKCACDYLGISMT